jgi:hypothetical protein
MKGWKPDSLAIIREVDAKVHEIVFAPARFIYQSLEHSLVNLVRDIAEHDLL